MGCRFQVPLFFSLLESIILIGLSREIKKKTKLKLWKLPNIEVFSVEKGELWANHMG
jgi:hypothetical protein